MLIATSRLRDLSNASLLPFASASPPVILQPHPEACCLSASKKPPKGQYGSCVSPASITPFPIYTAVAATIGRPVVFFFVFLAYRQYNDHQPDFRQHLPRSVQGFWEMQIRRQW